MKSLAIWYKPKKEDSNPQKVELHINIWKLPSKKKEFERFIDIGIHLNNAKNIEELYVYYPSKIKRENVVDLGGKIDEILLDTLFNDNYNKTQQPQNDYCEISNSSKEILFYIYKLKDENIEVSDFNNGTRIKIRLKGKIPNDKVYIRIRIDHDYSPIFSSIDKPSNSVLQSAFSKTEIIDFRVNEARELDSSLLETIEEGGTYSFQKIDHFFICSSREEYVFSHIPFDSARQLERDRWNDYIGKDQIKDEAILAYQWKVKEKDNEIIKHFNALVQTRYERNTITTIIKYIIILMILTVSFNLVSSYLYNKILPMKHERVESVLEKSKIENNNNE